MNLDVHVLSGVPVDHLTKMNHSDLPPALRGVYSKRDPIYRTGQRIAVEFRSYRIITEPGFITDLATIPWWLRMLGISRFTGNGWMDLGAILHDGIYRGCAAFDAQPRRNRAMADQLLLACWLWSSNGSRTAWRNYYAVRALGCTKYDPRPEIHSSDVFTIQEIVNHD